MRQKAISYILLAIIFCNGFKAISQQLANKDQPLSEINKWFNAWEMVWKKCYKLKKIKPVDFVLFDETFVYTNSNITGEGGDKVAGPNLLNEKIKWIKKPYNDSIVQPNGQKRKVEIMSFASQNTKGNPFFVMPLPSYWKKNGVSDHGIGIEILVTCVFLHEFGHTQQMQSLDSIDVVIEKYSKAHPAENISDDILQDNYEADSAYTYSYSMETKLFNKAAFSTNEAEMKKWAKDGIALLKSRQTKCLITDNRDIVIIDNFF
ncbi:hypothetical protein [Parasediminibacterium sp. JCM 36343]|uniref:hypothetical protein n=1 Tax=Parasediminibacterium sp. JCM 36343 TaxID=3374279 RepID=UPI00397A554A